MSIFNSDIFNSPIFNAEVGIGLSEEAGIGLAVPAKPPVDFVMTPYWRIPRRAARRADNQDRADLREMTQMYSEWRMAA